MAGNVCVFLCFLTLFISVSVADWNILNQNKRKNDNGISISLKNYCEGFRINVELNNIRRFEIVPEECTEFIGKYMTSTQYKVDIQRALDECTAYLTNEFTLKEDGKDAWIFDIDDTLLSTIPYYKTHGFGGKKLNKTSLDAWMKESKAPVVKPVMCLYNEIKRRGLKIFLISSRGEHLRDATIDNLVSVGYYGWTSLVLRGLEDDHKTVQKYKAEQRKRLTDGGYRIWGIVGSQWSSLEGSPSAKRTFKLPNSLYYVA